MTYYLLRHEFSSLSHNQCNTRTIIFQRSYPFFFSFLQVVEYRAPFARKFSAQIASLLISVEFFLFMYTFLYPLPFQKNKNNENIRPQKPTFLRTTILCLHFIIGSLTFYRRRGETRRVQNHKTFTAYDARVPFIVFKYRQPIYSSIREKSTCNDSKIEDAFANNLSTTLVSLSAPYTRIKHRYAPITTRARR